ncbi:hypothetical protein Spock_234 [Bacillus phage Spock]|uniref:Uncharacterized protein n=2 Tax=Bequatrovirus spock TaxID=1918008 RepID=A0A1X9SGG5_9CAUD|nr:hypothetical protein Spock_234 [Bacillus phage Spock]AGY48634.1 hypothetical protein Spock_234 [Bacillus phage Spock]ARQ95151.1 hypothetical protein FLAPJACK_240 [Bacillus phage Flapjack]
MNKALVIGGSVLVLAGSLLISNDHTMSGGLTIVLGANITGWASGITNTINHLDREGYLKDSWYKKYSKNVKKLNI